MVVLDCAPEPRSPGTRRLTVRIGRSGGTVGGADSCGSCGIPGVRRGSRTLNPVDGRMRAGRSQLHSGRNASGKGPIATLDGRPDEMFDSLPLSVRRRLEGRCTTGDKDLDLDLRRRRLRRRGDCARLCGRSSRLSGLGRLSDHMGISRLKERLLSLHETRRRRINAAVVLSCVAGCRGLFYDSAEYRNLSHRRDGVLGSSEVARVEGM